MKLIELAHGKFAKVDDSDFDELSKYKWFIKTNRYGVNRHQEYAARNPSRKEGKRKLIYMHREITKPLPGFVVDHINKDGLDNRRMNLRVCTTSQNLQNRGLPRNNTSGFKGVSRAEKGKWRAVIKAGNYFNSSNIYKSPEDAAHAYDTMAKKVHGEFAHLNFPDCLE